MTLGIAFFALSNRLESIKYDKFVWIARSIRLLVLGKDEKDGGTQLENESVFKAGTKTGSEAELDDARSSCFYDGGSLFENKSGVKVKTGADLNDKAESSRLSWIQKDEDKIRLSAVIRSVFGDSDDEPSEYGVQDGTNHGEKKCIYAKHKVNYEKELKSEDVGTDGDTPYGPEKETAVVKLEGQSASRLLVLEIPQHTPFADQSQMSTIDLSNIIGIDHKPFDPATYVDEDFYVTDASGCKRLIPPSNIIRWRKVIDPDGTTSVESNARFVTWSDGSLQLFIGTQAFDVSEKDADEIQSHVFCLNEAIYKAIGRICKTMKVEPSSLSCNSNYVTAPINSQDKEAHNVGQGIRRVDPEIVEKQSKQAEMQTNEDKALFIQKKYTKKAPRKCKPKRFVLPSNVEDVNNEGLKDPHRLA